MSALAALWSSSTSSAPARQLLNRFARASLAPFRWYHRRLTQSPLVVKSLTSGTVIASADLLSQRLRRPPPPPSTSSSDGEATHENWWNVKQTVWMGLYGALFVAPFSHQWYHFLERKLPMPKAPSVMTKLLRVMQRVTLDQLVVSPVFASGLFLSRGLIAGEDLPTIWDKTRADFLKVILAGAFIWPPAQMVNFFFVPLPYRVLFINMVGFGWSTYTSLVASRTFHCDPSDHQRPDHSPCGRPHEARMIHTFLPRYMWMHSHPYSGSTTAPPPYTTVNSWKD